ncbi:MAG: exodeoxyribonuclease VII large subunit [Bacilli bacterium]|nr:exodeoxyribonuclease VII large subunit [Bacilli bacterium]
MQDKYITVTQLTRYIKFKIDNDENLNTVFLKGEISNFKAHTRGHYYFTLKDENARVNAVMFASSTNRVSFSPCDGMKVMVVGKISVYEANGGYQIYVNEMIEDGVGNLYLEFEKLKKKLADEGLFDKEKKKVIPKFPNKIGIITAPTGAAIRDILSTIKRRWPVAETILFPALVQGTEAAKSIVKQIEKANTFDIDVLIVGRGGGSIEDLWPFNEEIVARSIYNSYVPIISAVGHEVDFTIADFVADLRAPTPTGAAEMAVPNIIDFDNYLKQVKIRLNKAFLHNVKLKKEKFLAINDSYILKNPMSIYEIKNQKFDNLYERLQLVSESYIYKNRNMHTILCNRIDQAIKKDLTYNQNRYLVSINKLEALNPLLVIKRGYSVLKKDNKAITSIENLKKGDNINIELMDGVIDACVSGVNNYE